LKTHEIAFMGKITAGITHEMNNVLAIIRESAGLIQDILSINKDGPLTHREKVEQALARVEGQVVRGVELNKELNRFAHSMDQSEAELELGELLIHIQALNARFARLRQVDLNISLPSSAGQIRTNPFLLLQLFNVCVESCLGHTGKDGEVVLSYENTDSGPAINIIGSPFCAADEQAGSPKDSLTAALAGLDSLLQELQLRLSVLERPDGGGVQIKF